MSECVDYSFQDNVDHYSSSPIVERGRKAIDMVADLKKFWSTFSERTSSKSQGQNY